MIKFNARFLFHKWIEIFIIRPDANSQESYAESRDDIKRRVMNGDEAQQE